MDANTRFEILAEAFYRMTGEMAPGKDVAAGAGYSPREERSKLFGEWQKENKHCINAMLSAVEACNHDQQA